MGGAAVGGRGCSSILRALARSSLPWPTAFVLRPRMRFEVAAAYAMGIGLPLLETLRRRTNFETISGYVDDFLAGALLLYAARAFSRWRPSGPVLLVVAWSSLAGGLYGSFFGPAREQREPRRRRASKHHRRHYQGHPLPDRTDRRRPVGTDGDLESARVRVRPRPVEVGCLGRDIARRRSERRRLRSAKPPSTTSEGEGTPWRWRTLTMPGSSAERPTTQR